MSQRAKTILRGLERDEREISQDEIEAFCKNAGYLKLIRYRSLEQEYSTPRIKFIRSTHTFFPRLIFFSLENEFENTFPPTLIHYYLALRAYDKFLEIYSRPPGKSEREDDEEDLTTMTSLLYSILDEPPSNPEMVTNACMEMSSHPKKELTVVSELEEENYTTLRH